MVTPATLAVVTKAWQEGRAAGRRGLTASSNPYPVGSAEASQWLIGLSVGRAKRLSVVDGGRCD
jgi:hypothetical protein